MSKMIHRILSLLVVGGLLFLAPAPAVAEYENSVNAGAFGLVGGSLWAGVGVAEYERLLRNNFSVFGRLGYLSYGYDDGTYTEDGSGPGIEGGVRWYPMRRGLSGFYVGAALGVWTSTWKWVDDKGESYESRGEGDSTALDVNVSAGYRIPLGSQAVSITPSVLIGNFINLDSSCKYTREGNQRSNRSCDTESELSFYGTIGATVGFAF